MAPKRNRVTGKQAKEGGADASAEPSMSTDSVDGEPTPNVPYMAKVSESWQQILEALPEIKHATALPMTLQRQSACRESAKDISAAQKDAVKNGACSIVYLGCLLFSFFVLRSRFYYSYLRERPSVFVLHG